GIAQAAFAPGGKLLALACGDGTVRLSDAAGKELAELKHAGRVDQVAFSPDGKTLATLGASGPKSEDHRRTVKRWDVASGKDRLALGLRTPSRILEWSPDGKVLATGGGADIAQRSQPGEVKLWDAAGGKELAALKHTYPVYAARFAPDGKLLAVATGPVMD